MMTLLVLFVAVYAFFAGMMAEYAHSRGIELHENEVETASLIAGLLWPYYIWRKNK